MALKRCSKCGHDYDPIEVRKCPHPAVNEKYGKNICVWCCPKCKFSETAKAGGLGCNYKEGG